MKKKIQIFKTVKIPHLNFTVHFLDMSKLKGVPILGDGYTVQGEGEEQNEIFVFFTDIKETVKSLDRMSFIAHELTHVLQIMCERNIMRIEQEREHTAYIMGYLFDELLGYGISKQ